CRRDALSGRHLSSGAAAQLCRSSVGGFPARSAGPLNSGTSQRTRARRFSAAAIAGPGLRTGGSAIVVTFDAGQTLADERVGLIRQFGEQKQIIASETVGVVKPFLVVDIRPSKRYAEERALICPVFPNRG